MDHRENIQKAADALAETIRAARADGYRVDLPLHMLTAIGISETGRVKPVADPVADQQAPVAVIGKASKPAAAAPPPPAT